MLFLNCPPRSRVRATIGNDKSIIDGPPDSRPEYAMDEENTHIPKLKNFTAPTMDAAFELALEYAMANGFSFYDEEHPPLIVGQRWETDTRPANMLVSFFVENEEIAQLI